MKRVFIYIFIAASAIACKHTSHISSPAYVDVVEQDSLPIDTTQLASDLYMRGAYYNRVRGNDSLARKYLVAALERDSLHSGAMFELASLMVDQPDSSLGLIKKAVEQDTLNSWYRYMLSRLYAQKGYVNEAIFEAEKSISQGERSSEGYLYLASLYQMKERPLMAVSLLDSAMVMYGYQDELVGKKLELLSSLGMVDKEIDFMEDVVASGENFQRHYLSLGQAYSRKGEDSLALASFEKARVINSLDPAVAYTFMEYYRSKGRTTDFLAETMNLIKNDYINVEDKINIVEPYLESEQLYRENHMLMDNLMTLLYYEYFDDYRVSKLYIRHQFNMGQVDKGLDVYRRYADGESPSKDALENTIGIYTYKQSYDSAHIYYQKAMKLFPSHNDIQMMGVTIAYGQKDYQAAIDVTKKAIKSTKSDSLKSTYLGTIGDLYHELGDLKSTYRYYDKALAQDSTNLAVLNNYSYFLSIERRDLDRALAMIEKVVKGEPTATHLDTHGWILYELGRYQEAKRVMQRAVALDKDNNATLLDHYAYILLALGDATMAKFYWDKALANGLSQSDYDSRLKELK